MRPLGRPPEIAELNTADLVKAIEVEFDVSISDADAERIDGSFDSISILLNRFEKCHRAFGSISLGLEGDQGCHFP